MAEIRKIVRSAPQSNFSRVDPIGGTGFAAIAAMAQEAYDFLEPIAMEQEARRGDDDAAAVSREQTRRTIGDNRVPLPAQPRAGQAPINEPPTARSVPRLRFILAHCRRRLSGLKAAGTHRR